MVSHKWFCHDAVGHISKPFLAPGSQWPCLKAFGHARKLLVMSVSLWFCLEAFAGLSHNRKPLDLSEAFGHVGEAYGQLREP